MSGAKRTERRARTAASRRKDRRSWVSQTLAALGISALGLAVAGSISLSTSAQTRPTGAEQELRPSSTLLANQSERGDGPAVDPGRAAALAAFGRESADLSTRPARSAALRSAVVKEQAAQRAEELAKSADVISREAYLAVSQARQSQLSAADLAARRASAALAEANLRRAVAARVAAANNRQAAQDAESDAPAGPPATGGGSSSPVPGAVIGAHFGQRGMWATYHTGLDFRAGYGTPIRAVKAGVVLYAGNSGDWAGNHVAVKHADGMTTMYSHMSSMAAHAGQSVQAGQVIGYVGQTGRAFGPHLHFELYPAGVRFGDVYRAINPVPWLSANGVATR